MFRSRAVVMATVLITAFTAATGTGTAASAGARIYIPWTQQTVFALAPDRSYVAEWNGPGEGWTVIGGAAQRVLAGSAGVFEIDDSGDIEQYSGTPGGWTVIGGPGFQFVEGAGHLYAIGVGETYVAEWNGPGEGWTVIGGAAADDQIYAGPAGLVLETPYDKETLLYGGTPGAWTEIGGPAGSVGVGNAIYRTDPSGEFVEQWSGGTTWTPIFDSGSADDGAILGGAGGGGLTIECCGSGTAEYKYNGTPYSWTEISAGGLGNPLPSAVSDTQIYGITVSDVTSSSIDVSSVDIYNGSGTSWTVIGGPAYYILGAGD